MTPDHVLEDVAYVLALLQHAQHGVDRAGADLMAALDEFDELPDDGTRLCDALILALDGQAVAAQSDRAAEPVAKRLEDAVADACQLGRNVVRNGQDFLHSSSV